MKIKVKKKLKPVKNASHASENTSESMVEKKSSERGIINCPPSCITVIPLVDKSDATTAKSNKKMIDSCEVNLIFRSKSMMSKMICSPLSNKSIASAVVFGKIRM
ncbi:hypothetical protein DMUE_0996 [Dictyocoela muelleri]|nr:hypothetical protein DMUE_0996 [Dictyocoela muelleri]